MQFCDLSPLSESLLPLFACLWFQFRSRNSPRFLWPQTEPSWSIVYFWSNHPQAIYSLTKVLRLCLQYPNCRALIFPALNSYWQAPSLLSQAER